MYKLRASPFHLISLCRLPPKKSTKSVIKETESVVVEPQQTQEQYLGGYTLKSRMSGKAGDGIYEKYKDYYNQTIQSINIPGITIIRSKEQAKKCLQILTKLKDRPHSWDTETIDLNVKSDSLIGNGKIICCSAFCGIDVDFGNGPRLFIDNFAQNMNLIQELKEYFENDRFKKIWHNYGFDRHVFYNHNIDVKGFGGDTMHMARLVDPSRGPKEYSLASITAYYEEEINDTKKQIINLLNEHLQGQSEEIKEIEQILKSKIYNDAKKLIGKKTWEKIKSNNKKIKLLLEEKANVHYSKRKSINLFQDNFINTNIKINMRQLFGKKKSLKTGGEGRTYEFPTILRMHTDPDLVEKWIKYSTLDSEVCFFLYETLKKKLYQLKTNFEGMNDMWDLYQKYWLPFGELLTDMERIGFKLNISHLKQSREDAQKDILKYTQKFTTWMCSTQPNIEALNQSSTQQLQQLFFAPFKRNKNIKSKKSGKKQQSIVKLSESEEYDLESLAYQEGETQQQQSDDEELSDGRKKGKRKEEDDYPLVRAFKVLNDKQITPDGKKKPPKQINMNIQGLGWPIIDYTESGLPSVEMPVLKKLAGNPSKGKYGVLLDHYKQKGEEDKGKQACEALEALIELRQVETLLQTFIIPLTELTDSNSRIHCSININTETGRLSARKPNLLNQPTLDKDKYKIRQAFCAEPGNKLIVADYGQLELRVLAHMTKCTNMIQAFKQGGDFHSRTAMGMYPKLKEEIQQGKLLLEWDKQKGVAPAPLLKEKYANERKKAKTMNFSIAYGKSAHGFAKDWNCSIEEAQQSLEAWFSDRKEVKQWQENVKAIALDKGWTQTLMGRYRNLTKHLNKRSSIGMTQHGLRAAINTPIQGGAADLVIAAMIKVYKNEELKKLGWNLLLQIHDELILEGPQDNATQALKIVKQIMENPLDEPLLLELEVDAKIGNNWYECK